MILEQLMMYWDAMQKRIYTNTDQLRAGHQQLALAMQPELFLTLATNQQMSLERMQKLTRMFLRIMDKQLLGDKFFKFASDRRMDGLFYVEHEHSNTHVHGLINRPYCNRFGLQLHANRIWRDICPSGSVVVKDVGDIKKRSEYVTKEAGKHGFFERQFFTAAA
jgi:hypothetical protein